MKDTAAFEIFHKKCQVNKQQTLQALAGVQAQIKEAEQRLQVLYRYQSEYSQELNGVMQGGKTVGDFQYFLKFMAHLNKVIGDAKTHVASLTQQQNDLHKKFLQAKQECDELLRMIEKRQHHTQLLADKKQEGQLQDLYFSRENRNGL